MARLRSAGARESPLLNQIFQVGNLSFEWTPLILLDFICFGSGNCHRANLDEQLESLPCSR
jgi:hypothetical protein